MYFQRGMTKERQLREALPLSGCPDDSRLCVFIYLLKRRTHRYKTAGGGRLRSWLACGFVSQVVTDPPSLLTVLSFLVSFASSIP